MTVLLVLVGVAFTTFMLYLSLKPLVAGRDDAVRVEQFGEELQEIELLMARRNVLVASLRELEFEKETNKIAADDFERFRARYEREAVIIMRRLDDIHGGRGWQARVDAELEAALGRKPHYAGQGEDAEAEVEDREAEVEDREAEVDELEAEVAEVAEMTEDLGTQKEAFEEEFDQLEAETTAARSAMEEDDENEFSEPFSCSGCDELLVPSDKFCSQCGTPVQAAHSEEEPINEANA